ncbi:MAG: glycosyltransferase [Pedobacter sp.]|nr:MAG: glycosyltransferase [Pedobacter sp.]
MKVLHLNTYDGNGGAGRACLRLNKALNEFHIDSKVAVFYQFGEPSATTAINARGFKKYVAAFKILAERYLAQFLTKSLKTPFSLQFFGQNLKSKQLLKDVDIIHLHWINHGFLNPKMIAELDFLDKPVIWTFHDSNAFTGGCHVRYSCENFHRQCGNCPILKFSGPQDLSHRNWKQKQKAYSELNFQIIAPSQWMAKSVKESSLLGIRPIHIIPNTLEIDIFKPYVKEESKRILKITPTKFVILSGFMPSKNDKHKGTSYLLEALKLYAQLPDVNADQVELLVFGYKDDKDLPEFPFKTTFLGKISKDDHLAKCYSAADVFILPSLEDNLPNTVLESLACATPVVAFTTGGIPDMVSHQVNGYLANYKSAADLAQGIKYVSHHPEPLSLQKEARRTVLERFSPQRIADLHIRLYQDILDAQPK